MVAGGYDGALSAEVRWNQMNKRAVVLLSGGLDSATVLALARSEGYECFALSFRYGQRHAIELRRAERLAVMLGAARHVIVDIDLRVFGASALTAEIPVPKHRTGSEIGSTTIPITYVPARNTIFLAYATAWAEVLGAADIFIGVNALDYSGYPDCRPEFIAAFERMANLATRAGSGRRHAACDPLQALSKAGIIRTGAAPRRGFCADQQLLRPRTRWQSVRRL